MKVPTFLPAPYGAIPTGDLYALWNSTTPTRHVLRALLADDEKALGQFKKTVVAPDRRGEIPFPLWSRKVAAGMTLAIVTISQQKGWGERSLTDLYPNGQTPRGVNPNKTVGAYVEETILPSIERYYQFSETLLSLGL